MTTTSGTSDVTDVVILVHGIRTDAPWQNTLRFGLEAEGIKVELTNYGYFDLLMFLTPIRWIRQIAINRVWTLVRDIRKLYPDARLSFLAHSFGTYIVASILRNEFDFRAHRIVFCGSIVRYDFPFFEMSDRFTSPILNEVGTSDYLPAIAESITWGYGSAGTYGFRTPRIRDRWHNGLGHSQFLTNEFCKKFWIPFFANGTIIEADKNQTRPPPYIRILSRFRLKYFAVGLVGFSMILAFNSMILAFKGSSSDIAPPTQNRVEELMNQPPGMSKFCSYLDRSGGETMQYPQPINSPCGPYHGKEGIVREVFRNTGNPFGSRQR